MKSIRKFSTTAVLPLFLLTLHCIDKPYNPASTAAQRTEILRETIGSDGGTVTVYAPDEPFNGMTITVPSGAFSQQREFVVSHIDLPEQGIPGLDPVVALGIGNGGGYCDSLITVSIPADIGSGNFAMPFIYHEKTGEIEGLPLTALDENGLTFITRHFDGTASGSGLARRTAGGIDVAIVVSRIPFEQLRGIDEILSDFEPGSDDWEFVNHGSLIAAGGHCAGQVLSAMWYYYEQRLNGQPALNGRYDLSDDVWQDNRSGYRLASVVQQDYTKNDDPALDAYMQRMLDKELDSLGWYSFVYALKVTGQPQFVGIKRNGGGHALIVNGAWPSSGELWITDPNHPGNRDRRITYDEGTFDPYLGAANADDDGYEYPWIGYLAKTALVNWSLLDKRWEEFEADTVGQSNFGDLKFTINVNGIEDSLTEIYECIDDTVEITLRSTCNACYHQALAFNGDTIAPIGFTYTDELTVPLPDSANLVGIYTVYEVASGKFKWTDFRWFTIKPLRPAIEAVTPDTVYAESTLTIQGRNFGNEKDAGNVMLAGTAIPPSAILSWTDTRVRLTVPQDGHAGLLMVKIGNLESNAVTVTVLPPRGLVTLTFSETIVDTMNTTFYYGIGDNLEATIYHQVVIEGTQSANALYLFENWRKHGYDYRAAVPTRYGQRYTVTSSISNPTGKVEGEWISVNDSLEEKMVIEWSYDDPTYYTVLNDETEYQDLMKYLPHTDTAETNEGTFSYRLWVDVPDKASIHQVMNDYQIGYPYERVELTISSKFTETLTTTMVQRKIGTDVEIPVSESTETNTLRRELLFTILKPE